MIRIMVGMVRLKVLFRSTLDLAAPQLIPQQTEPHIKTIIVKKKKEHELQN
jgi:hypothetical protein